MSKLDFILEELVTANRVLANEGIVDSFGHVSARHPERPDHYLLSRARAPERIEKDDIVKGVDARREELDGLIAERLSAGWTMDRLDKPMRQILRCGAYELVARPDVPVATAISEYVDVADAFYDKREKGFVNGLLDAVAKAVRG